MQQHLYPDNWKQRVQEADQRAGGRCERCGAVLGTMRLSRKHNLYLMPLHTSHVNHDPENPQAEVEKLCPSCHGKTHPWLPGTPTKERPYGYQAITLSRVLKPRELGVWRSPRMTAARACAGASATCPARPPMCWMPSARRCTACAWNGWSNRRAASMDEQQWARYLRLLACHKTTLPADCVGCWYEQHPSGEAFPGEQVSSTLCHTHRMALPMEVKQPDTLRQRRYT